MTSPFVMGAFITALALIFVVSGCGNRNSAADLRAHGVVSIHDGAPFCMIYVGLESNELASFNRSFWHFADQHGIRRPRKRYTVYSGPPKAGAMSDHVAFYVNDWPTPQIVARHNEFDSERLDNPHSWELASIGFNAYMPTNACLIKRNGHELLAPYAGTIGLAPYDTNYPVADFKSLSEGLIAAMKAEFPNRAIRFVSYDGENK